ncbi:30S ribosomal protein S4 [Candidatus Microgenomates bacterium]|nr:30S ribosomal protein S4 [Candidatus Microgenomates bacterium]
MARYTGPKDRLSRREGFDLFGKGAKLTRLMVTPGVHGPKGQMKAGSQYGKQLREKQKAKRLYQVSEKQFKRYMEKALETKGNTAEKFFSLLESRLDNTVFRLGFAKTRFQSRQMVSHRHILVNGKKVNIPSYQISIGDTITLSTKAMDIPSIKLLLAVEDFKIPGWLQRKAAAGQVKRLPIRDDVQEPISEQDIIEYYSR